MTVNSITQSELKELLNYDPETGFFTRISSPLKNKVGERAGYTDSRGYIRIKIHQKPYRAHRLAFLYMIGKIPKEVDHINHVKDDNRWINLRTATRETNCRNASLRKDNLSGFNGVHWRSQSRKWASEISGKLIGLFDDKQDAIRARQHANIKYGYHENHGKL